MEIFSILLLMILVVFVAGFLIKPFRDSGPVIWDEDLALSELLAERERILDALVELDFDNDMEKVPEEIYGIQRDYLLSEAADIMKTLKREYPENSSEEAIEEQVAARKTKAQQPQEDEELEAMIRQRRAAKAKTEKEPSIGKFCPECGQPITAGDRFCTSCGTKL